MCSVTKCEHLKKMACRILQHHYISNHLPRYIDTLSNDSYLKSIGLTHQEAHDEMNALWRMRSNMQKYDEIRKGKRIKKEHKLFPNIMED